jgi:hypothetical protein
MKHFLLLPGILSLLLITPILGQVYSVPFGSEGNRIELDVVNVGDSQSKNIVVKAVSYPSWVNIQEPNQYLNPLQINDQSVAEFSFSISKQAPVGTVGVLTFEFREGETLLRTKEIRIESEAPKLFTLFQNYPNPFNPSTTLSWQLPQKMNVELSIFNTLGQRVFTKTFDQQVAGLHSYRWQAGNLSSGVYFYELLGNSTSSNTYRATGKMLLVK